MPNTRFALCMIVKDGAHEIGRVLDGADRYWDQVVVLDTGSTDGTQAYIKKNFPFVELHQKTFDPFDFSKARNHALSFVDADVWMWLDSDDTYTEDTAHHWRRIADDLHNRPEDDPTNYVVLPYIYRVDENDVPLVIQFRERIMRGGKDLWQWREPLHEVCHYIGNNPSNHVAYAEAPVVHRPSRRPEESADRNWQVLYRHYEQGDRSNRTLYYLLRTANGSNQHELALHYGLPLVEESPGGYYEYEGLKGVGEAYAGIYNKTRDMEYFNRGKRYLEYAIRFEPQRNEARATLIDLYLAAGNPGEAMREAIALNEDLPKMIATLATEQYGVYKYAVMAMISFGYLNNAYDAMRYHLKAMRSPRPHVLSYELEKSLRVYLHDNNIGVFYCDESLNGQGLFARDYFRKEGIFSEVWVFNDPTVVGYARNYYLHLTEQPEQTLYKNDGGIRLRKFLFDRHLQVTEDGKYSYQTPFGYEGMAKLPNHPQTFEKYLEGVTSDQGIYDFENVEDIVRIAKETRCKRVILHPKGQGTHVYKLGARGVKKGEVKVIVDKEGNLVNIVAWTDDLAMFYVDGKGLRAPSENSFTIHVLTPEERGVKDGFRLRITPATPDKGKIVFYAPGVEDWDGTTPYRWGIGASESSVVYLAEEMAKLGYEPVVYTTVTSSRLVSGVLYVPLTLFKPDLEPWELFVASRSPQVLEGPRKAKRQVLWMHDVPQAYATRITDTQIIDKYVCVSEWQKDLAETMNYRKQKLAVIPNGIHRHPKEGENKDFVPGRFVWASQPERGVDNLHRFQQDTRTLEGLFNDVWVAYGFYNIMNYGGQDPEKTFISVAYWKHTLLSMGAKIVGRIPNFDVRDLMDSADCWAYPSEFPETFCVTGVEALRSGLNCFVAENGATAHTLSKAMGDVVWSDTKGGVFVLNAGNFAYNTHGRAWINNIQKLLRHTPPVRTYPSINDAFLWPNVANQWIEEIINE